MRERQREKVEDVSKRIRNMKKNAKEKDEEEKKDGNRTYRYRYI